MLLDSDKSILDLLDCRLLVLMLWKLPVCDVFLLELLDVFLESFEYMFPVLAHNQYPSQLILAG